MPLPKPSKSEKQSEFIQRCMTDDVMVKEYPNKNQRLAICANIYRNKRQKMRINEKGITWIVIGIISLTIWYNIYKIFF